MGKGEHFGYGEFEYATKKINQWYKREVNSLSIITSPFNSNVILGDIILTVIGNREKVLYVWGEDGENRDILDRLRRSNKKIDYTSIKSGEGIKEITFVNYRNIEKIQGKYELVIFDDISSFSTLNMDNLREKYEIAMKLSNRNILYTIEEISPLGERIDLAPITKKNPFVEPRLITTRIDLNKDIPYILYDYLRWFRDQRKRVVIYVPNEEKLKLVYDYYSNKLRMDGVKIVSISKKDGKKSIRDGLKYKDKATFIITDFMEGSLEDHKVNCAVVLFADHERYDYKKLLYICGRIWSINDELEEVLFVSRDVSREMDNAKEIARDFNKMIWRKGLVKL